MFFNKAVLLLTTCLCADMAKALTYCQTACKGTDELKFGMFRHILNVESIKTDGIVAFPHGQSPISCKCTAKLMNPFEEKTPVTTPELAQTFKYNCLEWRVHHGLKEKAYEFTLGCPQ